MELFKIIKKAFDLVRNEVARASSDSKSYATKLVDAEATRTDIIIDDLEKRVNSDLRNKVSCTLYIKTTDISNEGELSGTLDAEFLEWNILRRIYTKGMVGKTFGPFRFYASKGGNFEDIQKNSFFNLDKLWAKSYYNLDYGKVRSLYNVELNSSLTSYKDLFFRVLANYISCKNLIDTNYDCSRMLYACSSIQYIDFEIPSQGTNHAQVCDGCVYLRHKNFNINWPNSVSAQSAFSNNRKMKNDMSSKLMVTLPLVSTMYQMFYYCDGLSYVGDIYAPVCTYAGEMFEYCYNLESVGNIELPSCSNMINMFRENRKLRSVKSISTLIDGNIDIAYMFYNCIALTAAPSMQGIIVSLNNTFYHCTALKSLPLYKVSSEAYSSNAFNVCENLTDLGGFDGLKNNVAFAQSPMLTRESCLNLFNYAGDVTTYTDMRSMTFHSEAYARLTEEDIAIAVNKGWAVLSA